MKKKINEQLPPDRILEDSTTFGSGPLQDTDFRIVEQEYLDGHSTYTPETLACSGFKSYGLDFSTWTKLGGTYTKLADARNAIKNWRLANEVLTLKIHTVGKRSKVFERSGQKRVSSKNEVVPI